MSCIILDLEGSRSLPLPVPVCNGSRSLALPLIASGIAMEHVLLLAIELPAAVDRPGTLQHGCDATVDVRARLPALELHSLSRARAVRVLALASNCGRLPLDSIYNSRSRSREDPWLADSEPCGAAMRVELEKATGYGAAIM